MSGLGRRVFTAGEVLTAANVNGYLMDQSVMVFADSTARSSAIGTATEGMVTYLKDTDQLEVYNGASWADVGQDLTQGTEGYTALSNGTAGISYQPVSPNYIINGAMDIAQRGTAITGITSTGYRTADRWNFVVNGMGTWTQTIETDAPASSGAGSSIKLECTTAQSSPAGSALLLLIQTIEGANLQTLKKGSSNAFSTTVSFWAKSNVTGTYIIELQDLDNNRQVSASYTIDSADTWEYKTAVIAGDTSGPIVNDNTGGISLNFYFGSGSDRTSGTLNTTWAATTNANRAVGQTNLAAATSNYIQITGVQLEAGSVATPFKRNANSLQGELAECQRYYIRYDSAKAGSAYMPFGIGRARNTTISYYDLFLPVEMRTNPTFSSSGTFSIAYLATSIDASSLTVDHVSPQIVQFYATASTGVLTAGDGNNLRASNNNTCYIELIAEL